MREREEKLYDADPSIFDGVRQQAEKTQHARQRLSPRSSRPKPPRGFPSMMGVRARRNSLTTVFTPCNRRL
jgi:hypothetical protein